jgi:hypothetical protein
MSDWKALSECVCVTSHWVTLIGERWPCDKGKEFEFWRVEKADSVTVLPLQAGHIFSIVPTFRPGIGRPRLVLSGGRLPAVRPPRAIVRLLLQRKRPIAPAADDRNVARWAAPLRRTHTSHQRLARMPIVYASTGRVSHGTAALTVIAC